MKQLKMLGRILAVALPVCATSCTHYARPVRVTMQSLPPLSGRIKIESTIVPRSQKFKVAVLTFIDQTGRAQLVVDPIADMLTTELYMGVKRFELYDRQDLVEQTHAKANSQNQDARASGESAAASGNAANVADARAQRVSATAAGIAADQKTAHQKSVSQKNVDGVLLGYITSFKMNDAPAEAAPAPAPAPAVDPKKKGAKEEPRPVAPATPAALPRENDGTGEFSLDFRIVNTVGAEREHTDKRSGDSGLRELVVFGDSGKVRFRMKGGNIELERADVARIAAGIKEKFPDFSKKKINITSLQERTVSLSVGDHDGVKQGFTGYVVKHDDKTGVNRYLAEFVIINVFDDAATALVVADSDEQDRIEDLLGNINVGSEAVIK